MRIPKTFMLGGQTITVEAKDKSIADAITSSRALADMDTMAMTVEEATETLSRAAGNRGVLSDIPPELLTLTARQVKHGKARKILIKKWRKEAGQETIIDRIDNWLDSLFRP